MLELFFFYNNLRMSSTTSQVHLCTQLRVRIPKLVSTGKSEYFPIIEIASPFLEDDCAPSFSNALLVIPPITVNDVVPPFSVRTEKSTLTLSGIESACFPSFLIIV